MKRYLEYKDSGVDWIGEIPAHWKVRRNKRIFNERDDRSATGKEELLTVSHITGVSPRAEKNVGMFLAETLEGYKHCSAGNLVINTMWAWMGALGISTFDGIVSPSYNVYQLKSSEYLPRYYDYLYRIPNHVGEIIRWSKGVWHSRLRLYPDAFFGMSAITPPFREQTQIANFLDRKTGQIDELIRIKERRIELLREQRTALINQAVTKGLDLNVEMKSSGVEWIGEIPKHWTISKVKHEFESLDNLRIPLNSETRGNMKLKIYDYYGASGVIDKVENCIFDEPLILIGEDGANLYLRSTPLAFKATGKYWVNNHAHVLRPKHGNIDYLTNMLESLDYIHYITGAAQPKLTSDNLMNITVITPPPLEQDRIANFLDRKAGQIDQLITAEQRKIELLKEYRQSLISEAVTGKIDVRNEV